MLIGIKWGWLCQANIAYQFSSKTTNDDDVKLDLHCVL